MKNYLIKIDLNKIDGAFVTELGRNVKKQCVCIPLDGNPNLIVGKKGIYLDMIAMPMREPKYYDTHLVRANVRHDVYEQMTEEERRGIPILGGLHELENTSRTTVLDKPEEARKAPEPDTTFHSDDLPF